ncbi:hypothetical protein [Fodinicurvata sediminis]|uniref:hypothetical protein n=1 Tax=Fodinicurvata sediminis TaxID=1121832 RepID=UPI0003B65103|nr:hypothetical protein [Fodinicurvata sediminis]
MYRDNSLMPNEAIRLLALGLLAERPRHYAELAGDVRHFTERMVGPSLDLLAQPLELLKLEGLAESVEGEGMSDNALLQLTDSGQEEMRKLLSANMRAQVNDLNKLIVAIKMRFLHLLPVEDQKRQLDLLIEIFDRESVRLNDLRSYQDAEASALSDWLDLEISQSRSRLAWFEELRERLESRGEY